MKRMGIEADTTVANALELFPQAYPLFTQIGMCCVNEENENWTVEELCRHHGVDPESFLDALRDMTG